MHKTLAIALLVGLSIGGTGCVEQRPAVRYEGLGAINELHRLEPRLVVDPNPEFFAPWQVAATLRPLSAEERLALEVRIGPLFMPNELGIQTVASQFALLTQPLRPRLEQWLERSEAYMPLVRQVFAEAGLPAELAYLPFIESGYSPVALSSAGARGMWQFMPETGKRFGLACCDLVDERTDPLKSSLSAAAYLRELYLRFGDWGLALAAYNAGEGRISRLVNLTGAKDFFQLSLANQGIAPERRLPEETLLYVPRFIAMMKIIENLDRLGFEPPGWYNG